MVLKEVSVLPLGNFSSTVKVPDKPTMPRNHFGPLSFLNDYQEALQAPPPLPTPTPREA